MKRLRTLVISLSSARSSHGCVTQPNLLSDIGLLAADAEAVDACIRPGGLSLCTLELHEDERRDIESEASTIATVLSMPVTKIEAMPDHPAPPAPGSWGIEAIGAAQVPTDAAMGVRIALLDTGIDPSHPAFHAVEPVCRNFTADQPQDRDGQGSHLAGTIFGQDVGSTRIGVARGLRRPLIGKVLGAEGGDSGSLLGGLIWAQGEGAHVIALALRIDHGRYHRDLLAQGFTAEAAGTIALSAYRENVRLLGKIIALISGPGLCFGPLIVAGAGNESRRPDYSITAAPPASDRQVVSVGALDRSGQVAGFSSTDPNIAAPGVDILSAGLDGRLCSRSGTGTAMAHAAGIAVLRVHALLEQCRYSPRLLRHALLAHTRQPRGQRRQDVGTGIPYHGRRRPSLDFAKHRQDAEPGRIGV